MLNSAQWQHLRTTLAAVAQQETRNEAFRVLEDWLSNARGGGGVSERVDNAQTTKASLRQTSNQILKQCSTNWCRENALTG